MRRQSFDHQPFLSLSELGKLLSVCGVRDRALFLCMYEFGLRASEPGLLTVNDFMASKGRTIFVHRVKGSHSGTRPVSDVLRRELRAHMAASPRVRPWLFPGRTKEHGLTSDGVRFAFREVAARAGLPPRAAFPHILKHSRATHLVSAGASRKYIQDTLGHALASSTDRYFHLTERERQEGDRASQELLRRLLPS